MRNSTDRQKNVNAQVSRPDSFLRDMRDRLPCAWPTRWGAGGRVLARNEAERNRIEHLLPVAVGSSWFLVLVEEPVAPHHLIGKRLAGFLADEQPFLYGRRQVAYCSEPVPLAPALEVPSQRPEEGAQPGLGIERLFQGKNVRLVCRDDTVQILLGSGKKLLFFFPALEGFYAEPEKFVSFKDGETEVLDPGRDCEDAWGIERGHRLGWTTAGAEFRDAVAEVSASRRRASSRSTSPSRVRIGRQRALACSTACAASA